MIWSQNVLRIVFAAHILFGIVYNNNIEIKIRNRYKNDTVLLQKKTVISIWIEISLLQVMSNNKSFSVGEPIPDLNKIQYVDCFL